MPGKQRKHMLLSYEEIKNGLLSIGNQEDRFLLAASYANGTRVSEVVGIKAVDVSWNDRFVYLTTLVRKKRARFVPQRSPPLSRKLEPWLTDLIISYVDGKEGRLINYSVRTAQRRFDKYFNCTTHSFRHTRATHCITVFNMSMRMIADYFKISPASLSDWVLRYGHLDRSDIEAHLEGIE